MKSVLVIISLIAFSGLLPCANSQTPVIQQINSGWQFRQIGNLSWFPAKVPGTVHLDLIANNIIPDPYYRDNINNVQWVEIVDWQYTVTFSLANPSILNMDSVQLVFEGLDTHASVDLNNQIILQANNMFRTWIIDVKGLLQAANNTMTIVFQSAVNHDNYFAALDYPLVLPAENTRIYSRKAAYHYGWDWGPRLVTCGIWKNVYIKAWNYARFDSVYYKQVAVSNQSASISTQVSLIVNNSSTYLIKILNGTNQNVLAQQSVTLAPGQRNVTLNFTINNPQLWWVRGLGGQYLYNMTAQLSVNSKVIDQQWSNIGLRTIKLIQQNDTIGTSFYLTINGISFFAKGGNYIPPDMFMPRVTPQVYNDTLQAALDANYNFIRVWGGGNYENDTFYDICDRIGILLWQEFMFADGMYSARPEAIDNMRNEFIDNVKRIRNHPSIAMWCGNNEILEGWNNWGWQVGLTQQQLNLVFGWYQTIFLSLIPSVLNDLDPVRPYWPTSPEFGWGHDESLLYGDSHYWGVWAGGLPIENYINHVGRFVSEYGMQGMLCMNNIKKFSISSDWNFNSSTMHAHERHANGWPLLNYYMGEYKKISDFFNFAYGTQIMQKYALQTAIEAHRRNKPNTMGTLVWQLNDVWPVFSWATRDFYGTWKAAHYMKKHMYSDIVISFAQNQSANNYDLYIISDKQFSFNATLNVTAMALNGNVLFNTNIPVVVAQDSSKIYYSVSASSAISWGINSTILIGELYYNFDDGYTENHYYFVKPVNLTLTQPHVKYTLDVIHYLINFTTDVFAIGAYISNNSTNFVLSDNYFDLIPGRVKSVKVYNATITNLIFTVTTIFDAYDKQSVENEETSQVIVDEPSNFGYEDSDELFNWDEYGMAYEKTSDISLNFEKNRIFKLTGSNGKIQLYQCQAISNELSI